ncbi:Hydroxymethylpyrimidine phosphate kinase ThiD [hydrothermal vent metagenome]|uniref:Hydroxymethylpyrimidine phosphate kinase ThiD n=1 Tax=hydrothermal vent metagenome TaxID=652676 RepID=A0A3B0R1V0_9ZZZZ
MHKPVPARILSIAGSDSGGGAGVQADIKTITALGGYAASAITAITAQNTLGVSQIEILSPALVRAQIIAVLDDIGADMIKIGMLGSADMVVMVAETLRNQGIPIVLDPVMVAKGGADLVCKSAIASLAKNLLPQASLVTPNIPEAQILSGIKIKTLADQRAAAEKLLTLGPQAVLVKGGHLPGDILRDVLLWQTGEAIFEGKRLQTRHTHGTGCTLASAIATYLAQGLQLEEAVRLARKYLQNAIANAPGFGAGHGPLDHGL